MPAGTGNSNLWMEGLTSIQNQFDNCFPGYILYALGGISSGLAVTEIYDEKENCLANIGLFDNVILGASILFSRTNNANIDIREYNFQACLTCSYRGDG